MYDVNCCAPRAFFVHRTKEWGSEGTHVGDDRAIYMNSEPVLVIQFARPSGHPTDDPANSVLSAIDNWHGVSS